ncbi:MAG: hypothetical protein WC661_15030 [Opitutaceae bacterium]|jgi:hypothetical protein
MRSLRTCALVTVLCAFAFNLPVSANVTLAPPFTSHAVLQQSRPVPVWGKTSPVESVPVPVALRYAWRNAPGAILHNTAGLPAVPFRTDKLVIQSRRGILPRFRHSPRNAARRRVYSPITVTTTRRVCE